MDEVSVEVPAVESAPEPIETVSTEPVKNTPEAAPESKTFTQEELDAAIGKRLAREQRKWEREQAQRMQQPAATVAPAQTDYETVEQYAEALAAVKAEQLLAKREQEKYQREVIETYHEKEEDARAKYDDFEQVAYNPNLRITDVMAECIQASDIGPDVVYYLGTNPKEAERISKLSAALQGKEIGKLETKLSNEPPVKKATSAPAPISPVTAKGSGTASYSTDDPRSMKNMSTSEWIEADRQRQIKKLEAQRFR